MGWQFEKCREFRTIVRCFYVGSQVFCRCLMLLGMALSLLSHGVHAASESRLALLIGNSSYKNSPLANPVNDVRLMEAALKESGFTVIKAENASIREMRRLVRDFGDKLKATGGVGLFYFAGHGVQVRGENFLVSTDSDIRNEDEVADDSINANVVLEKMQSAGNRVNLVILDACRNNPFAVRSRTAVSGLANMSAPSGSLVAYATAPGSVASDGNGKNGLYTEHLAKVLRQPGLAVEEVFKQVRAAVRRDSNNQQTPWENTALEGQFYFRAPLQVAVPALEPVAATVAARPAGPDLAAMELALWDSVKAATTAVELQAYLNRFPNGFFADVARARIAAMASTEAKNTAEKKAAAERVAAESARKAAGELAAAEAQRNAASQRAAAEAAQKATAERAAADIASAEEAQKRAAVEAAGKAAAERQAAEASQKAAAERSRVEAIAGQKAAAERAASELAAVEAQQRAAAEQAVAEAAAKAAAERLIAEAKKKVAAERVVAEDVGKPNTDAPLGTLAVGDVIGALITTDEYGKKASMDVTVLVSDGKKIVYSTGDAISRDGQVLQVKVGVAVLRVVSGALWKIPVKAGTSGVAEVKIEFLSGNTGDTLKWSAVAAPGDQIQIVAAVAYRGPGGTFLQGEWLAIYDGDHPLPVSFSTNVNGLGGSVRSSNKLSAELSLR